MRPSMGPVDDDPTAAEVNGDLYNVNPLAHEMENGEYDSDDEAPSNFDPSNFDHDFDELESGAPEVALQHAGAAAHGRPKPALPDLEHGSYNRSESLDRAQSNHNQMSNAAWVHSVEDDIEMTDDDPEWARQHETRLRALEIRVVLHDEQIAAGDNTSPSKVYANTGLVELLRQMPVFVSGTALGTVKNAHVADFVDEIIPMLQHMTFYKGTMVIRKGADANEMFFIKSGSAEVSIPASWKNPSATNALKCTHGIAGFHRRA